MTDPDLSSEASTKAEALAAKLEAAEEGSRALSDEVLWTLGWKHHSGRGKWYDPNGVLWKPTPSPAESVEDGLALLRDLPGEWVLDKVKQHCGKYDLELFGKHMPPGKRVARAEWCLSLECALCAALVRAAQAQQQEKSDET